MPSRVLVIGCGNIGAGYDFDNDQVLTHAKAFAERDDVLLTVADVDEAKARRIAQRYDAGWSSEVSDDFLRNQDIVSICVATPLHFSFLSRAVASQVPVILCEKPIVNSLTEIAMLERFALGRTRIIVNYMRRFQPGYADVRRAIATALASDPLRAITIRYGRGFLNNAGHALDLLEYLLGTRFEAANIRWVQSTNEGLEDDPTRSGTWMWGDTPVYALGLAGTKYFMLEIDVHTRSRSIEIRDSGDRVDILTHEGDTLRRSPDASWTSLLTHYMRPVASAALACLAHGTETNFQQALALNKTMLRMVN